MHTIVTAATLVVVFGGFFTAGTIIGLMICDYIKLRRMNNDLDL